MILLSWRFQHNIYKLWSKFALVVLLCFSGLKFLKGSWADYWQGGLPGNTWHRQLHRQTALLKTADPLTPAIFVHLFKESVRPFLEYDHCCGNQMRRTWKVAALILKMFRGQRQNCWDLWRSSRTLKGCVSWSFHVWKIEELQGFYKV